GDARAVGAEGDLDDVIGVATEHEVLGAGLHVPDKGLVQAAGEDKSAAVGAECQPPKDIDVPPRGAKLAAGRDVPALQLTSRSHIRKLRATDSAGRGQA